MAKVPLKRKRYVRDVDLTRAVHESGVTFRPEHARQARVVAAEIERMAVRDARLRCVGRSTLEFLLSMGLLVINAAERASLLHEASLMAVRAEL